MDPDDGVLRLARPVTPDDEDQVFELEFQAYDSWYNYQDTADDYAMLTVTVRVNIFTKFFYN